MSISSPITKVTKITNELKITEFIAPKQKYKLKSRSFWYSFFSAILFMVCSTQRQLTLKDGLKLDEAYKNLIKKVSKVNNYVKIYIHA